MTGTFPLLQSAQPLHNASKRLVAMWHVGPFSFVSCKQGAIGRVGNFIGWHFPTFYVLLDPLTMWESVVVPCGLVGSDFILWVMI